MNLAHMEYFRGSFGKVAGNLLQVLPIPKRWIGRDPFAPMAQGQPFEGESMRVCKLFQRWTALRCQLFVYAATSGG